MGLYNKFSKWKEENILFPFDEITAEDLERLFIKERMSDRKIAELFDINPSEVSYRRRKFGITIRKGIIDQFISGDLKVDHLNKSIKEELFTEENLSKIAIGIAHFAFRNGSIEDMHAHPNSQLSEKDKEVLNKFVVNRLAYVFDLLMNDKWFEFKFLIESNAMFCTDWDEAIPDDGGTKDFMKSILTNESFKRSLK